jgi:L-alanine-DL-glutamate epimerase-like enolase superfamily enzyme
MTPDATFARTRLHPLEGIQRQDIKITDLKVTLLSFEYPPEEQLRVVKNIWWKSDSILVEIFTDQGVSGIGGSSRYSGAGCCLPVKAFLEEIVKPTLIGQNPFDLDKLAWGGKTGVGRAAWAGAEAALFDILGKVCGRPVYDLLAIDTEPNTHLRVYASAGVKYAWYDRPDQLIEEAAAVKEQGFTAYKFRPGTDWAYSGMTVDKFIPYLIRVREAVGADFDLALEMRPWSLEEALQLAPVLEDLNFTWFEEPMSKDGSDAIDQHLRLQEALPTVMISGGEAMLNRGELKEWFDRGAYDMLQPDAGRIGLLEAWQLVRMAGLRGKPFCPHNWGDGSCTLANAALVAGNPNALMLEQFETFDPLRTEIFKDPPAVVDGYMDLPKKPGFGVELAPNLEQKFPYLPGGYSDRPNPVICG